MKNKYFEANFPAKNVTDFLNKQLLVLKDLTPLMKVARVFMKYTVDQNFETESTHTGEKWKEWSDSWKKQRLAMGRGQGKILNLEGELRRSIQAKHGKDFALVGTNKVYAALHNFGGTPELKRNKNMPKREFMRMDDVSIEELQAELYIASKELLIDRELRKKVSGND